MSIRNYEFKYVFTYLNAFKVSVPAVKLNSGWASGLKFAEEASLTTSASKFNSGSVSFCKNG